MYHIAIISSSVRIGRNTHRVALFFKKFMEENNYATAEILDLNEYAFPIFDERLKNQKDPLPKALDFAERFRKADGILIVTPEYNGGYPASLKNAIDLLTDEWNHKPVAISTVSNGPFGGQQVITSIQYSLWKLKALTVPALFPNPKTQDVYDEKGNPTDKEATEKRATAFVKELLWITEAAARMKATS